MSVRGFLTEIHGGRCLIAIGMFGTWFWDVYPIYSVMLSTGIPLAISVACYAGMMFALGQSTRQSKQVSDSKASNVHKLRLAQMNIFKTCLLVLISFIICHMSLQAAVLMFIFGYYKSLNITHYKVGYLLAILNSCLNPYIYAIRYDDFKDQLFKLVGRGNGHKVSRTVSKQQSGTSVRN